MRSLDSMVRLTPMALSSSSVTARNMLSFSRSRLLSAGFMVRTTLFFSISSRRLSSSVSVGSMTS
ncbi:hypothetical protein DSECCO2_638410 [anaerobic digester metagenome]